MNWIKMTNMKWKAYWYLLMVLFFTLLTMSVPSVGSFWIGIASVVAWRFIKAIFEWSQEMAVTRYHKVAFIDWERFDRERERMERVFAEQAEEVPPSADENERLGKLAELMESK